MIVMLLLAAVLIIGIAIAVPISYSIAVSGAFYLLVESTLPVLVIAQRMVVGVDSFTLLAIPLFLLAGALMAEGDITPRIMRFASSMVGHIRGGMAMVMVVSCMFFGAISGSGVADVAAIGSIMLPAMKGQSYKPAFSASLLGCGGALATIIPPSIVMVVLGVTMGASIGKLFIAGFIPGILSGGGLMLVSYYFAKKENYPRLPKADAREKWEAFKGAFLPMVTPAIIIVGILEGIFTATEAGAVALTLVHDVAFRILREDVPLNGKAIKADHAVKFRHDEEDERVEQAIVIGVHADQVRIKHARVREHADEVREHEKEKKEGRDQLNPPKGRVFMVNHADMRLDVTELMIGSREAAKCAEHVHNDAKENKANEQNMHPEVFFPVNECATRSHDEVHEEVFAELHGARKGHVAKEEDAEDEASNGLENVEKRSLAALTLGILKTDAPNVVGGGWNVRVLDGIRSRHDDCSY